MPGEVWSWPLHQPAVTLPLASPQIMNMKLYDLWCHLYIIMWGEEGLDYSGIAR